MANTIKKDPPPAKLAADGATFDKEKFAKYLRANVVAAEFGEGKCAKHVRLAVFEAGRKLNNWPVAAKDWGGSLLALGFQIVPQVDFVAQKGDIAVMQAPKSATRKEGHIQGHDGTNWISDFVQAAFWPGPSFRKDKPDYTLYRY